MNSKITLEDDPKKEGYKVRRDGDFIGQATTGPNGEVIFSNYKRNFKYDADCYNDLVNQITALIKEREIAPSEE